MHVKVSVINIGNELLLGQTINTNLSWLGKELAALGLPITRSVTVMDEADDIKTALATEWKDASIVIMTGGLGPTKDDITKAVIVDFFARKLEFKQEIWEQVQSRFTKRGLTAPEINRSQAMIPADFEIFINNQGTAPGLHYSESNKLFFALPGVPIEMKHLFSDYVKDILIRTFQHKPIYLRTIHTWKTSESALAEKLSDIAVPEDINFAWLPQTGRVDLRIYGNDEEKVNKLFNEIRSLIPEKAWGYDSETPGSVLHDLLLKKKLTISVAESCTGGLVGKIITDNPGASSYFLGSITAYNNSVKQHILRVNHDTINRFGAVSIETAGEMAAGVRAETGSDIGISVTGIAGPDGGTKEKPVGTVCFGIACRKGTITNRLIFNGDRYSIRFKAAEFLILSTIEFIRREL